MSYIAIFLGGILSFFSPCILPVLPLYIGYLSGNDLENKKTIVINTIFFTTGISFAFIFLALGFSTLGQLAYEYKDIFTKISGILTVALGLFQLGIIKNNLLAKERRFDFNVKSMNPFIAFIFGFTFSFAWTPCIGPALSGVLFAISSIESKTRGIFLMGIYTLGFIIPFLITGFFSSYFLKLFKKNMKIVKYTPKIMGVLLIILGVLIYTGKLDFILSFIS
ncbi:cytochrome c biogenesis CcdA family protein [Fusobacterium sp.]|uniref:cytochrome c biogenesis CcdA family protein n=1 Tax=Fusobacterium sp. TaxID=68766 RepID=UPI00396CC827